MPPCCRPIRSSAAALWPHIACEIHPLNNLRVLQYLSAELGVDDEAKNAWYRHWVAQGLAAVEQGLETFGDKLSLTNRPGYLEACLVPQVYNARRFACDLAAYPRILEIVARCETLPAFSRPRRRCSPTLNERLNPPCTPPRPARRSDPVTDNNKQVTYDS